MIALGAIQRLPKVELHLHLQGAIPPSLIHKELEKSPLVSRLSKAPKELRDWLMTFPHLARLVAEPERPPAAGTKALIETDGFEQFLASYVLSTFLIDSAESLNRLVVSVLDQLLAQSVIHAEIIVGIDQYRQRGIPIEATFEILNKHRNYRGMTVTWILDLVRDLGVKRCEEILLENSGPNTPFTAISLGGNEQRLNTGDFKSVYRRARNLGLNLSAHAGEVAGPESVWQAVKGLGATRIGHGVRAIEDPALLDYLAKEGIGLEVCITSNIKTGVYRSLAHHPLPVLVEAGIPVTLSTDDPTFFGTNLSKEYQIAQELLKDRDLIAEVACNSAKCAFLDEQRRPKIINSLKAAWAKA